MRKIRGFTLIELAVVFAIIGLLFVFFIGTTTTMLSNRSRAATRTKLTAVQIALALYVTTNRRLPCPADGSLAVTSVGAGAEQGVPGTCLNNQTTGVVPWVALGLSQADVTDSWSMLITYRVDPKLTIGPALPNFPGGMDMSLCDPAGTAAAASNGTVAVCDPNCTSAVSTCTSPGNFLGTGGTGKGLTIKNAAGTPLMDPTALPSTGAAYVLISHGDNQYGAFPSGGGASTTTPVGSQQGTSEIQNANNTALQAFYVDDDLVEANDTTHFDDIVLRPSILSVINAANLGPRAH